MWQEMSLGLVCEGWFDEASQGLLPGQLTHLLRVLKSQTHERSGGTSLQFGLQALTNTNLDPKLTLHRGLNDSNIPSPGCGSIYTRRYYCIRGYSRSDNVYVLWADLALKQCV